MLKTRESLRRPKNYLGGHGISGARSKIISTGMIRTEDIEEIQDVYFTTAKRGQQRAELSEEGLTRFKNLMGVLNKTQNLGEKRDFMKDLLLTSAGQLYSAIEVNESDSLKQISQRANEKLKELQRGGRNHIRFDPKKVQEEYDRSQAQQQEVHPDNVNIVVANPNTLGRLRDYRKRKKGKDPIPTEAEEVELEQVPEQGHVKRVASGSGKSGPSGGHC